MTDTSLPSTVRPADPADVAEWVRMRRALWPKAAAAEVEDVSRYFCGDPDYACFVVPHADGTRLEAFLEMAIRPFAEGCETGRVAYMEGWWVEEDARQEHVGGALVAAAEAWARSRGCREMAADVLVDNVRSQKAHERLGFTEVERQVCYRKDL